MKTRMLVILAIWGWIFWIYKNQNWVVTPNEAKTMYDTGSTNLRLLNFGLIALALSFFYLKTNSGLSVLFLAISPWWIRFGVFERNVAWLILINMIVYIFIKNKLWLLAMLLAVNIWPIYKTNSWFWVDENINIKNSQTQTIIRFEQETQINGGREIIPVKIKKIAYNKYFYPIRLNFIKLAGVVDFENISSPSQKNITVSNNPFSKKGISMIPIVILVLGLFGFPNIDFVLLGTAIVCGYLGKTDNVLQNSLLLAPTIANSAAIVVKKIPKFLGMVVVLIILFMARDLWKYFIFEEVRWNDNKNRTLAQLADIAHEIPGKLVVTEMLGPTRWYYFYKYGDDKRINFTHFDLEKETRKEDVSYIGLPGEFAGNKGWAGKNEFTENDAKQNIKILKKFSLIDTVSYGNGDEIWVGK